MFRMEISMEGSCPSTSGRDLITFSTGEIVSVASLMLASLVSVRIAGFFSLTFDCHSILERLQHATWPTHDLHAWLNTARYFDIGFARNARGDFNEPHLVILENVNTLLRFRFLTIGRCSRDTADDCRCRRRSRSRRLLDNRFERYGQDVVLRVSRDRSRRTHAGAERRLDI